MEKLLIRNENKEDYTAVERVTREAFWNVYVPGCSEHYLAHVMRSHKDFIPELDFVAELDGRVIGNIMYTKARLTDENGHKKKILTFGPISILPEHQHKGYGKLLMEHSFREAVKLGFDVAVIFGSPENYVGCGFKSCHKYNICLEGGRFPAAMLVKELKPQALDGRRWYYRDSPVYQIDGKEAEAFDGQFEYKEKKHKPSQETFYILSHAEVQ